MKIILYTILLFGLFSGSISAQNVVPIAFDLSSPIDVNLDAEGKLWVTESGSGDNDGAIVKILPDGTKETIIENLPSYFDPMSQELQGALSTQVLVDGRILVCQGEGPDTLSATIIEFHLDDFLAKGAALTPGDQRSVIKHGEWVLANGFEESNPYSFVLDEDENLIISDAAANAIFKYTVTTQEYEVLTTFPPFMNPTPIGPPFVDVVPTKIITHPEGGYLVASLTGFPFLDEAANIYHVQDDGSSEIYASGLTLVTDMAFDQNDGNLIALQFATYGLVDTSFSFRFNSAQLIKIEESGELDTLLSNFGPSAGLALSNDGSAYMTHLFLGQLLKSDPLATSVVDIINPPVAALNVYPNPTDGRFEVELNLEEASPIQYSLMDLMGREILSGQLDILVKGQKRLAFDFRQNHIESSIYQLSLFSDNALFVSKIFLK